MRCGVLGKNDDGRLDPFGSCFNRLDRLRSAVQPLRCLRNRCVARRGRDDAAVLSKRNLKFGLEKSYLCNELSAFSVGWRRSADRTCLRPNSLQTGNFTGKQAILAARRPDLWPENAAVQRLLPQFPTPTNREIFWANRVSPRHIRETRWSFGKIAYQFLGSVRSFLAAEPTLP